MAEKPVGCVFRHPWRFELFSNQPKVRGELLYFPTRMDPSARRRRTILGSVGKMTILVGNSGDRSNEHIAALARRSSAIWRYGSGWCRWHIRLEPSVH
ncbi:TDP-N-acetylfucosamine:lipid II N-acetylfucosaminyltransferase [Escherichia coli]